MGRWSKIQKFRFIVRINSTYSLQADITPLKTQTTRVPVGIMTDYNNFSTSVSQLSEFIVKSRNISASSQSNESGLIYKTTNLSSLH